VAYWLLMGSNQYVRRGLRGWVAERTGPYWATSGPDLMRQASARFNAVPAVAQTLGLRPLRSVMLARLNAVDVPGRHIWRGYLESSADMSAGSLAGLPTSRRGGRLAMVPVSRRVRTPRHVRFRAVLRRPGSPDRVCDTDRVDVVFPTDELAMVAVAVQGGDWAGHRRPSEVLSSAEEPLGLARWDVELYAYTGRREKSGRPYYQLYGVCPLSTAPGAASQR